MLLPGQAGGDRRIAQRSGHASGDQPELFVSHAGGPIHRQHHRAFDMVHCTAPLSGPSVKQNRALPEPAKHAWAGGPAAL